MYDVSCKLISKTYIEDDIGREQEQITKTEVPIIKNEYIGTSEYYPANQIGYKPSLQLRISALNYNDERELEYMNVLYTVIRAKNITADETTLICERKKGNV